MSIPVHRLRNIGPRCAGWLAQINIRTADDLRVVEVAAAYRELVIQGIVKPHWMLLYALGGALGHQSSVSRAVRRFRDQPKALVCKLEIGWTAST